MEVKDASLSAAMVESNPLPCGCWPTMITPFLDDGSLGIDYPALGALVDWYIASGCSGLFACCQSSEMYDLSPQERLQLVAFVVERAAGRAAVVACGSFGESVEDMASFITQMADTGVDAVVVLTCALAKEGEPEEVWQRNAEQLLQRTSCRLGLYEVPVPYKRCLSPALLRWCAQSGRFFFHKDTCCSSSHIAAKLRALEPLGARN